MNTMCMSNVKASTNMSKLCKSGYDTLGYSGANVVIAPGCPNKIQLTP
jgi:hypothetical protein